MKVFFVNERLAFGSAIKTCPHVERLRAVGITHVLNLRRRENSKMQEFRYLWLKFADNKKPRPPWFYRRALTFYRGAMSTAESKLFVMCHHGLCRSPSLTYSLLRASGAGTQEAEQLPLKARPRARLVRAYQESGENFLRRLGNGNRDREIRTQHHEIVSFRGSENATIVLNRRGGNRFFHPPEGIPFAS